jgi:flagellar hook assembly protein FlgD
MKAGEWTKTWDGKDELGSAVPSGVYFYRLQANDGEWTSTKKMILIR